MHLNTPRTGSRQQLPGARLMKRTAAPAGAGRRRLTAATDAVTVPAGRRAARASTGLWAGIVLAAVAGAALIILAHGNLKAGDLTTNLGDAAAAVAYATGRPAARSSRSNTDGRGTSAESRVRFHTAARSITPTTALTRSRHTARRTSGAARSRPLSQRLARV